MKKILALALTALVLLSICSLSVADEKKTLTVWVPQYQFSKAEDAVSDADFWNGWFDAFEAENNCEVNVEILPWSDYNTTIYTGLLNNDGPDVVYVTDTYDLVSNGLLLKLDDKLTQEQKDNFLKWEDGAKDKDGNHYSIAFPGGPVLLFYNKDILAEAGVEIPEDTWTWEEFIDACKTVVERTDKKAFVQNWGASSGTSALLTAFWPFFNQAAASSTRTARWISTPKRRFRPFSSSRTCTTRASLTSPSPLKPTWRASSTRAKSRSTAWAIPPASTARPRTASTTV